MSGRIVISLPFAGRADIGPAGAAVGRFEHVTWRSRRVGVEARERDVGDVLVRRMAGDSEAVAHRQRRLGDVGEDRAAIGAALTSTLTLAELLTVTI